MVPPGLVSELRCTIWPDTHSAPGLCDLVGDGFGLGDLLLDRDGDGLGECDGLGLLLAVGLVDVLLWLGLDELVGLCDGLLVGLCEALLVGLGVFDGLALFEALLLALFEGLVLLDALPLALFEGLVLLEALVLFDGLALVCRIRGAELAGASSIFADSAASELCPQGEAIGRDEEARTGAAVKPEARNVPAARQMAMRPTRMTPIGTGALRSSGQLQPNRDAGAAPCPQA
jgi:hypothetical protein